MKRVVLAVLVSAACGLLLTHLTVAPPMLPDDWARLDYYGVYIPPTIDYNWSPYWLQVVLLLGMSLVLCLPHFAPLPLWQGLGSKFRSPSPSERGKYFSVRHWCKFYSPSPCLERGLGGEAIALTLLGFWLRLSSWERLPLIIDEIGFAARASDILHGQHVPLLAPGHNGNPSLYSATLALSMSLWGQNLFAIRIIPILFGTLSIPAAYAFGRAWWSHRGGVIAAAFLATYPAHVFISRLSLYNIITPLFSLLTLALLGRAIRRGDFFSYTLVGITAAWGQYFYHGSRSLLVVMGVYILLKFRWRHLKPTLWLGLVLLILLFPLVYSLAYHDLPLSGNQNTLKLPDDFASNAGRAWLTWLGQRDTSPFWLSNTPLLPWGAMILFWLGLLLPPKRDTRYGVLLLLLILTTLFGGMLLTAAPLYVRYIVAVPGIVGFLVMGAERLKRYPLVRWGVLLLVCLQGIWIARWQHPQDAYERITPSQWLEDSLARGAAGLPDGVGVVFPVPMEFDAVQKITLADYVAAYGQRRPVSIRIILPAPQPN
jgi:hypothetical protein